MTKVLKGTEKRWKNFLRPGLKIVSPSFSAAVAARTKNPHVAQATSNILKSKGGGKILSIMDMHSDAGLGLCVK